MYGKYRDYERHWRVSGRKNCCTTPIARWKQVIVHELTADGTATNRRVFTTLEEVPDGLAVDESGQVWVAVYGGSLCHLLLRLMERLTMWLRCRPRAVTSLCFWRSRPARSVHRDRRQYRRSGPQGHDFSTPGWTCLGWPFRWRRCRRAHGRERLRQDGERRTPYLTWAESRWQMGMWFGTSTFGISGMIGCNAWSGRVESRHNEDILPGGQKKGQYLHTNTLFGNE